MEVTEGQGNLNRIELSFRLWKPPLLRKMFEKFTTLYEIHYEIDAVCSLKHKVDSYNEGVVDLQLYQFFYNQVFD
jgi:hypothetical protein